MFSENMGVVLSPDKLIVTLIKKALFSPIVTWNFNHELR